MVMVVIASVIALMWYISLTVVILITVPKVAVDVTLITAMRMIVLTLNAAIGIIIFTLIF